MTDADLIGYLFDALPADEHAAVEAQLRSNPALMAHLEKLRVALVPLETDREPPVPPSGLADRTLAHVAAATAPQFSEPSTLRRAPREAPEARVVGGRFRPDWIAACGIAVFAFGLAFSAISKVRDRNQMLACQATLRTLHTGLAGYADTHNGRYPQVGTTENPTADSFVGALANAGQVPAGFRPVCPADENARTISPQSVPVGYTYTLGYRNPAGGVVGFRRDSVNGEHDLVPISADYPTSAAAPTAGPVCSHANGMNVLYAGGHVRHTRSPQVGPNLDDIYRNVFGEVAAGADATDVVLGRPGDRP